MLRLTVNMVTNLPGGSRVYRVDITEDGYQFEEQPNGVLFIYKEGYEHKINPHAWQTFTLEVIDD